MAELNATQLQTLKTEFTNDPKAMGYSGLTSSACADKLNLVGASGETLPDRKLVNSQEVMGAIDTTEWGSIFSTLTAAQKEWFDDLVAGGTVDASNGRIRTGLGAMFPNATAPTTRAALLALINRSCSRAEILFGAGTVVYEHDVIRARALP